MVCEIVKLRDAVHSSVQEWKDGKNAENAARIEYKEFSPERFTVCRRPASRLSDDDYDRCVHFER